MSNTQVYGPAGGGSTGDVVGPGSSTDNAIVRFDGTTGKLIQNSTWVLNDNGSFSLSNGSTAILTMSTLGLLSDINTDSESSSFVRETSATNAAVNALTLVAQSTGTAAAGFGGRLVFSNETATASTNNDAAYIDATWTTATAGAATSTLSFSTASAGTLAATFTMTSALNTSVNNFKAQAGQIVSRTATATDLNVTNQMYYVGVTSTAAARTITLPISTNVVTNQIFVIKDESGEAATNNITITCSGGATNIDGGLTKTISTNYGAFNLIWNGTQYFTW